MSLLIRNHDPHCFGALRHLMLPCALLAVVLTSVASCGRKPGEYFVFAEFRNAYDFKNRLIDVFPNWDVDVRLWSPQDDYYLNSCVYCHDYNYYMVLHYLYQPDTMNEMSIQSIGWLPVYVPEIRDRVLTDSVQLTLYPFGQTIVLLVDSVKLESGSKYYAWGIRTPFQEFNIPKEIDSLRIDLKARLSNAYEGIKAETEVSRMLYRITCPHH